MKISRLSSAFLGTLFIYLCTSTSWGYAVVSYSEIEQASSIEVSDLYIAQASSSNVINSLSSYVRRNQDYFDRYALQQANTIGENVQWETAALRFDAGTGAILLDLRGTVLLPGWVSLFTSNPPMQLQLLFTPNSCFQYRYEGYRVAVDAFPERVNAEVNRQLNNVKSDMERSLNSEVSRSLNALQLSNSLRCR